MDAKRRKRVLVLVNPRSGLNWSFTSMRRAVDRFWETDGTEVVYQFCQSAADGSAKAARAAESGTDIVLVAGGDGTVSSIGRELIGSDTALGVVPVGSGNGFARHFGISLTPEKAIRELAGARTKLIDVGVVNQRPFLVTCSMAWDAAVVRSFDRSPVRGILPYVFAGVHELFQYSPQDMTVTMDSGDRLELVAPMVLTFANLTQYGVGARIAPNAEPDDGYLELVVALRQDAPKLIANLGRLFDGSINRLPEVVSRRFQSLSVTREHEAPIQVDGELIDAPTDVEVHVIPEALRVLVP